MYLLGNREKRRGIGMNSNIGKDELFAILRTVDVNVDDFATRLMGNMNLIVKFLRRFPEDKSYRQLVCAIENGECEMAFRAAHTLKGVVANLSMTKLYSLVGSQVEALRDGDLQGGTNIMPLIVDEYNKIVNVINSIKWE